jgi:hypothetical protein
MPAIWTIGELLPNGATVTADTFTTLPDGTTVETMTATYPSGATNNEQIVTPPAGSPAANLATLLQRAQAALVNNNTYLAIPSPTQAQAITQVAALTRQVDGLIRFLVQDFSTTTGT